MGTVYLCEHAVLHRRLAVKVLRSELTTDPELVDRFRNEAIAASRIGQENVVDVLDFGTAEDGALYYVMEALDGRTLGAAIRDDGPLETPRALDLLEQICRALAAAHERGVVHRDVKPENVLVVRREDGSELAKVIDFGISHNPRPAGVAPITRSGAIIGTPEYMAPEQAAGEPVDPRTDVYAMGVLAFEMLTGELPIAAATPIATLVAHRTLTPDPPSRRRPAIPPAVDALVLRALAKKPEDRFESMELFAAEVARVRAAFSSRTSAYSPRPSSPRGETLALPETRDEVRRATLRVKRMTRIAVVLAALVAITAAGWLTGVSLRARASAPTAGAQPWRSGGAAGISTPTVTTADAVDGEAPSSRGGSAAPFQPASATTPIPPPDAPARVPVLVADQPAASRSAPLPVAEPARPRKVARRPQPVPAEPEGDLKDPYSSGGELKDPFK